MATNATQEDLEGRIRELEAEVSQWKESAEGLQEEHDFLAAVLSTADCLVIVLDPDGNIVRFNKACEALSGYVFEEVRDEPFWNRLLVAEEVESVKAVFSELSSGQFPNRHDNYWQTKDGKKRLISWSNTALLDDNGSVAHVIGTGIDITERRRAEEELRESHLNLERRVEERTAELDKANAELTAEISEREGIQRRLEETEERFRAFLDNSPALAYIKDGSGKHLYANKALCDTFEVTPQAFIGTTVHDFLTRDAADRIEAWDEETLRKDAPLETDDYSEEVDGRMRWWSEVKFPVRLPSGERLIGGFAFDITEQKRREEDLEIMKFCVDNTLDRVGWMAPDGRFLYANKAGYTDMHYTLEEILAMNISDITPEYPPEVWRKHFEELKRVGHLRFETTQVDGKGNTQHLDVSANYIHFGEKEFVCSFGRDITALKQNEQGLKKALEEVTDLKSRLELENICLREEIQVRPRHEEIVGKSKPVLEMLRSAEQVAETDATVLILGETGTGKELLARAIHKTSSRGTRQMIRVNCAALPSTLIEAELFGREKGAYTGAMTRQIGRFEIADKSTIFLDEIGELAPELQAKLLRVLEEGEFERLGSPKTVRVNVRVIATTNRDLAKAVEEGGFREDLYHRLNVFSVTVPPLRDRREDIPLLVWAFVKEFEKSMGRPIEKIAKEAIARLSHNDWPGNVRELRNVIERAMILNRGSTLHVEMVERDQPSKARSSRTLQEVERTHILEILGNTGWRVSGGSGAAQILGLKPTTLEARMKKLGIRRPA